MSKVSEKKVVTDRTLNRWLRLGLIRGYGYNGTHVTIIGMFGIRREALMKVSV